MAAEKQRPSAEAQAERAQAAFSAPMAAGDEWYAVSGRWFRQWRLHTRFDASGALGTGPALPPSSSASASSPAPGQLDNTDIAAGPAPLRAPICVLPKDEAAAEAAKEKEEAFGAALKARLQCGADYALVPAALWADLAAWYGPVAGGAFLRYAAGSAARVEAYPARLAAQVTDARGLVNPTSEEAVVASRHATVAQLRARLCRAWDVADGARRARLWDVGGKTHRLLRDDGATLDKAGLADGGSRARVLLEVQLESGAWPIDAAAEDARKKKKEEAAASAPTKRRKSMWRSFVDFVLGPPFQDYEDVDDDGGAADDVPAKDHSKGVCGLHNLGNTCFMNSALQCLSNTAPLCEYFVSGAYKRDINPRNAMGTKGQLAEQFGRLMQAMWSGSYSAVSPRNLKHTIGKWAPQFNGFNQHDSQELLAFLLDGLHEDLNEVSRKPFVEVPEGGGGKPDTEVADAAWEGHLRRNRSLVVRLFQGQLKSTVQCPDCHKTSITFDPFMYMSVPLPTERERKIEVVVFPHEQRGAGFPFKYAVKLPKSARIERLKAELSPLCGIPVNEMHLANSYANKVYSYLQSDFGLGTISDADINIIYQIPEHDPKTSVRVHVLHRKAKPASDVAAATSSYGRCPWTLMGLPFVLQIPATITGAQLYAEVWARVQKYFAPLASEPPFVSPQKEAPPSLSESTDPASMRSSASEESSTKDGTDTSATTTPEAEEKHEGQEDKEAPAAETPATEEEQKHGKHRRHHRRHHHHHHHQRHRSKAEPQHPGHTVDPATGQEYPFKLSLVSSTGLICASCPYNVDCYGCGIECSSVVAADWTAAMKWASTVSIAVDWCDRCMLALPKLDQNVSSVQLHSSCVQLRAEAARPVSIDDCMRLFTSNEQLGPEDPWYCPSCKEHKQAFKKFDLWRLPSVLIVHLKRFQYSSVFRTKLDTDVGFPVDEPWDLSPFVPPQPTPPLYRLFAVSCHMGGLGGGHYIAYCRNRITGKWVTFNDSACHEMNSSSVRGSGAYVLFYERVSAQQAAEVTPNLSPSFSPAR